MKPFDPRLVKYARATSLFIFIIVILGGLVALITIGQARILTQIISIGFQTTTLTNATLSLIGLATFYAIARGFLAWATEYSATQMSAKVKRDLRKVVMSHALNAGPIPVARIGSAKLNNLLTRGIDGLDAYFTKYLPQLVLAVVVPLIIGSVIAFNDLLSGLIIVLTIPLIPIFMILVGWYTQTQMTQQWNSLQRLSHYFYDIVGGFNTLKIFQRLDHQDREIKRVGIQYRKTTMQVLRVSFLSAFVLELLATLSVALIAVSIGVRLVSGSMDLYTGLLILLLAPEVYLPLRMVGTHFHAAAEGLGATDELFNFLEAEPKTASKVERFPSQVKQIEINNLKIEIEDLQISFPDFIATSGTLTLLTGRSGSGKTNLLYCLFGLRTPKTGTITIQDLDVLKIVTPEILKNMTWLPQHPLLLPGTVEENLLLAKPTASDFEINQALQSVGLEDKKNNFIKDQKGLSTGEARRVAFARLLLNPKQIVLLDEPTASLDEASSKLIVQQVENLVKRGHLVIATTHHEDLQAIADQCINLENNKLVLA